MKALTISLFLFATLSTTAQSLKIQLHAKLPEWRLQDGCDVFFSDVFSDSVNWQDYIKIPNPQENIGIDRGKVLQMERRSTYVTTPLLLWKMKGLEYKLKIVNIGITNTVLLEDTWEDTLVVLVGTKEYFFRASTDSLNGRFNILFPCVLGIDSSVTVAPIREVIKEVTIYPNPSKGEINIKAPQGKYQVTLVDAIGRVVRRYNQSGNIKTDLPNGMYWVVVVDEMGNRITRPLEIRN
jgi:hypothetical protein